MKKLFKKNGSLELEPKNDNVAKMLHIVQQTSIHTMEHTKVSRYLSKMFFPLVIILFIGIFGVSNVNAYLPPNGPPAGQTNFTIDDITDLNTLDNWVTGNIPGGIPVNCSGLNFSMATDSIYFSYFNLYYDTTYSVRLLSNSVKDVLGNLNAEDTLCGFTTELPKPCIDSIILYDPLVPKTNVDEVTYLVTFALPVNVNPTDFFVSGSDGGDIEVAPLSSSSPDNEWLVTIPTVDNTTIKLGVDVTIDSVSSTAEFNYCLPNYPDAFNIRKAFLAEFYFAAQYDNPSNSSGPGEVKIIFDEPLDSSDVGNAYNGDKYIYIDTVPSYYYLKQRFINYIPNINNVPFYVYFDVPHNIVFDEWGNIGSLRTTGEVNTVVFCEQPFSFSTDHTSPVEISMIRPFPVIDEASAMIDVYQDGLLTATLYNLSDDNKIATLLTATAIAGSKYDLNMRLGFLSNGVYTLIITLDDFSITRNILISR